MTSNKNIDNTFLPQEAVCKQRVIKTEPLKVGIIDTYLPKPLFLSIRNISFDIPIHCLPTLFAKGVYKESVLYLLIKSYMSYRSNNGTFSLSDLLSEEFFLLSRYKEGSLRIYLNKGVEKGIYRKHTVKGNTFYSICKYTKYLIVMGGLEPNTRKKKTLQFTVDGKTIAKGREYLTTFLQTSVLKCSLMRQEMALNGGKLVKERKKRTKRSKIKKNFSKEVSSVRVETIINAEPCETLVDAKEEERVEGILIMNYPSHKHLKEYAHNLSFLFPAEVPIESFTEIGKVLTNPHIATSQKTFAKSLSYRSCGAGQRIVKRAVSLGLIDSKVLQYSLLFCPVSSYSEYMSLRASHPLYNLYLHRKTMCVYRRLPYSYTFSGDIKQEVSLSKSPLFSQTKGTDTKKQKAKSLTRRVLFKTKPGNYETLSVLS